MAIRFWDIERLGGEKNLVPARNLAKHWETVIITRYWFSR